MKRKKSETTGRKDRKKIETQRERIKKCKRRSVGFGSVVELVEIARALCEVKYFQVKYIYPKLKPPMPFKHAAL